MGEREWHTIATNRNYVKLQNYFITKGNKLRFFILTLFFLPLALFAQEMLWSSESVNEVTQREYDEALKSYTQKKYAKEIARQKELERQKTVTLNGLMWQDDENAKSVGKTWNGAIEYCKNLSLVGYKDWRLPTIEELMSIVDKSRYPTIKKEFKNSSSSYYWSSTTYMSYKSYAWVVYFGNGDVYNNYKDSTYYVRCVRDGE